MYIINTLRSLFINPYPVAIAMELMHYPICVHLCLSVLAQLRVLGTIFKSIIYATEPISTISTRSQIFNPSTAAIAIQKIKYLSLS